MSATSQVAVGEHSEARLRIWVREHAWTLAIWGSMLAWTVVLFAIVRGAYLNFRIGRFDLGNMVQAVWSTTHGRALEMTDGSTGEQIVRLGMHVDPLLVLLAPLWALWPSPLALALAQIAVSRSERSRLLARPAPPRFRAPGRPARARVPRVSVGGDERRGRDPPGDVRDHALLFCVWFLDSNRLVPFALCAALTMSTGELMGLADPRPRHLVRPRARTSASRAPSIALAGLAWTFLAVYVVVGTSRATDSVYYGFYDEVGGSPQGVVRTLFTDPGAVLGALFEAHDIVYLLWLGLPLLFLFLLSPGLAAVALPQLLANGLSDFRSMTDPRYHSVAAIVPFLIAATVFGVARISAGRRPLAAGGVLACCADLHRSRSGPGRASSARRRSAGARSSRPTHGQRLADAVALVPSRAAGDLRRTSSGAHLSRARVHVLRSASSAEPSGSSWIAPTRGS